MVFIVLMLIRLKLLGGRLFGEVEFWLCIIKVVRIIGMVMVGVVLIFL